MTRDGSPMPLMTFDDDLQVRVARAIFRHPALSRYATQPAPPIHVVVDGGQVTLEGVVSNEIDKAVAFRRATSAGVCLGSVVNKLRIENAPSASAGAPDR